MIKYLHNLKNEITCVLFFGILFCYCNLSFSQNIRLKIERLGLKIFQPTNRVDACGGFLYGIDEDCNVGASVCAGLKFPDPVVNCKLIINATDYQLPEFRGDDYITYNYNNSSDVCVTGWTTGGWNLNDLFDCSYPDGYDKKIPTPAPTSLYELWYTNNNFSTTTTNIDVQFAAYEDDNVLCGGDDAWCGGWNSLRILNNIPNNINPCGQELKDEITCTSDGYTRIWGLHYKVSWQWRTLEPDQIDISKNICVGTNSVTVRPTAYGSLNNTNFQWQVSTDGTNWTNISGVQGFVNVNTSVYTTPQIIYVRKVKVGIACAGFPTPIDEYSNICIINIRPAPTTAPTATKLPNISGICEATIVDPVDQYSGVVPLTWEYQTSYDGVTWSTIQNSIPTLSNSGTTNVTGYIRFRASYACGYSPWRTYSWLLYPQIVAPTALEVYPVDFPFVTNYVCSTDSMYVLFNPGYGGSAGASDEFEYTTDGGATWLPYLNGQKIRTTYGVSLSYGIRTRRISPNIPGSLCNTSTPYKYYGYWTPYRVATAPTLLTKTPNVASFCKGAYANVSATILSGNFGVPGQATNQYQYSVDAGNTWQTYTSGANINTTNAVDSIYIRVRRIDGNPFPVSVGPCSTDWTIIAAWRVIDPICDFAATSSYCYNPNAPYIEIRAVRPSPGIGTWSIVSGSGSLSSTTAQNTQLTGTTVGSPTRIRWSVTESGCTETKDTIITPAAVSNVNLTNGNTCQTCPIRNGNTLRFYDNTGKLMAKIEDVTPPITELSITEVCVGIDASVQSVTTNYGVQQPYLQRHFSIDPTTNTTSNVTLYFTAAEFNNLKTACNATQYAFTNVNQLIVSKFPNGGNNSYTLPNTNGATYIIPTASGLDANGYYYVTIPVSTFSTFYIHSTNGLPAVLPIELAYFTGVCEDDKIRLEWETVSENNNHHFEVERSEDAINFETIKMVNTKNGNSNLTQNYLVYDNEPKSNIQYYRLKQVDRDDRHTYSKISSIKCLDILETKKVFSIYPNPTIDEFTIAASNVGIGNGYVKIYDFRGNLVLYNEIQFTNQTELFSIEISSLSSGMYVVELIDNDNKILRYKIVKQ